MFHHDQYLDTTILGFQLISARKFYSFLAFLLPKLRRHHHVCHELFFLIPKIYKIRDKTTSEYYDLKKLTLLKESANTLHDLHAGYFSALSLSSILPKLANGFSKSAKQTIEKLKIKIENKQICIFKSSIRS